MGEETQNELRHDYKGMIQIAHQQHLYNQHIYN